MRTEGQRLDDLRATYSRAVRGFRPPESLTVDEWADKYRRLSPESSAEAGPWRTSRTPYLREPMRAFTDPRVRKIAIVAGSQIGKTECELNCLAYLMDQDPGTVLFVHPTIEDAKKFSRLRVEPMIRDCRRLKRKVHNAERGGKQSKTVPPELTGRAPSVLPKPISPRSSARSDIFSGVTAPSAMTLVSTQTYYPRSQAPILGAFLMPKTDS